MEEAWVLGTGSVTTQGTLTGTLSLLGLALITSRTRQVLGPPPVRSDILAWCSFSRQRSQRVPPRPAPWDYRGRRTSGSSRQSRPCTGVQAGNSGPGHLLSDCHSREGSWPQAAGPRGVQSILAFGSQFPQGSELPVPPRAK